MFNSLQNYLIGQREREGISQEMTFLVFIFPNLKGLCLWGQVLMIKKGWLIYIFFQEYVGSL